MKYYDEHTKLPYYEFILHTLCKERLRESRTHYCPV